MLFDEGVQNSLKTAVKLINNEITQTLRLNIGSEPLDAKNLDLANAILLQFYKKNLLKGEVKLQPDGTENFMDMTGPGMSLVRACSEAIYFGVVSCFKNEMAPY